jgi:hypothetical protein
MDYRQHILINLFTLGEGGEDFFQGLIHGISEFSILHPNSRLVKTELLDSLKLLQTIT